MLEGVRLLRACTGFEAKLPYTWHMTRIACIHPLLVGGRGGGGGGEGAHGTDSTLHYNTTHTTKTTT